jgi:hypothetical protein
MRAVFCIRFLVFLFSATMVFGQANLPIYNDHLVNTFQDWSWGTHNFANTSTVHSGSDSISMTPNTWDGICFGSINFNMTLYSNLVFWVHGGTTGGQNLYVYLLYGTSGRGPSVNLAPLTPGIWQQIVIPISSLGGPSLTNVNHIIIQVNTGPTGTFYIDDVQLTANPAPVFVHVNIDPARKIRTADARWFGVNTAIYDPYLDTPDTTNALRELGTAFLRFPGGSLSDEYHWATGRSLSNTWAWQANFGNFMHVATNVGAQAIITVNYGTGTSNEAAAWVLSANVTNRCHFKYWEIGNECHGLWETDSNTPAHDPYTYARRAAGYFALMKAADPTIKIGVVATPGEDSSSNNAAHPVVNPRTGITHYGWTPVMLTYLKNFGVTPDFLIHHFYPQWAGPESDQLLMQASVNWAMDAADLRQQLQDYLGPQSANVELLCTENNNQTSPLGRQSTSVVCGLYLADSLSQLMKTEFNGYVWWDLRNGANASGSFDPTIYGWRTNGDEGLLLSSNIRYPMFYTDKLMRYFVQPGDTVLNPTSDYALLSAYGVLRSDGLLNLLVMNKDVTTNFVAQINLAGFTPDGTAMVRSYGILQDEATRTNNPTPGAQDIATNFLAVSSTSTNAVPPGTASLITFFPSQPVLTGISAGTAATQIRFVGPYGQHYRVLASSTLLLPLNQWDVLSSGAFGTSGVTFTDSRQQPVQFYRIVSP